MATTKIYFVRHGEALGNKNFTFQGTTDNPLTPKGIMQGQALSNRFKDVAYDFIYCSPLCRAADTAKLLNAAQKKPLVPDPSFIEICGGLLEDTPMLDLHKNYPEAMRLWDDEPWNFIGPMLDEGVPEAFIRLKKALRRIAKNHKNGAVVIVAHGFMLRIFNCIVSGLAPEEMNQLGWGDNTCVTCAEIDEDLNYKLLYLNDVSHIAAGMETQDFWVVKEQLEKERAQKEKN